MQYESLVRSAKLQSGKVADMLETNPNLITGYLVVGVQIDGSLLITHNTCCLAHFLAEVITQMQKHPSMNTVNPAFPDGCPK